MGERGDKLTDHQSPEDSRTGRTDGRCEATLLSQSQDDADKLEAHSGGPVPSGGVHTDGLQPVQRRLSTAMGQEKCQW